MSAQLPLALRHSPDQRLDSYIDAPEGLVDSLAALAAGTGEWVYLAGVAGSGKTHLALAMCEQARQARRSVAYLPLAAVAGQVRDALDALDGHDVVALDGLDAVAGRRGDEVAERVLNILAEDDRALEFGVLDISLYRDDFEHLHENPALQESDIPFEVEGAHIILVDDVLFTGRTIRAALDALSDYGRPAKVELAVLIDRGHREMPIQPDYVGISLDTRRLDHVLVSLERTDGQDEVRVVQKESQ